MTTPSQCRSMAIFMGRWCVLRRLLSAAGDEIIGIVTMGEGVVVYPWARPRSTSLKTSPNVSTMRWEAVR